MRKTIPDWMAGDWVNQKNDPFMMTVARGLFEDDDDVFEEQERRRTDDSYIDEYDRDPYDGPDLRFR